MQLSNYMMLVPKEKAWQMNMKKIFIGRAFQRGFTYAWQSSIAS